MSAGRWNKLAGPLKWILALTLLVFVIRSGKLDVAQLKIFVQSPGTGLLCCAITLLWYTLCFVRWRILLNSQGIPMSFTAVFRLGMLSQFFQTFMPGTVGADVIKAIYVGKRHPSKKFQGIVSVIMDRGVGLYAILVLGTLAFLAAGSSLKGLHDPLIPVIRSLGLLLCAVTALGIVTIAFLPALGSGLHSLRGKWMSLPKLLRSPMRFVREIVGQYASKSLSVAAAVLISLMTHLCAIAILFVIANKMFGPMPWGELTFARFVLASSLGLVVMALPISPSGLGVGQAAFASIFSALGVGNASFGASIVTAFQLVTLVMNMFGFLFLATYRQEIPEPDPAAGLGSVKA